MNETNYSAVDFSTLSATDDGKTLFYADNQLCQSISSLSEIVDSKIGDKGYASEDYVDGAVETLSSEADNKFATKDDLGKVGNFIVTSGDPETFEPVLDPTSAETKSIYLVQNEAVSGKDQYYEWIVTENDDTKEWTCIGETSIELSGYQTVDAMSSYYTKSETSGAQEIANALSAKQDIATLMNNVNIVVGPNNLLLTAENSEIQNVQWSAKKYEGDTEVEIEQDITTDDYPFLWNVYRGPGGVVLLSIIKFTFKHSLTYYDSIKIKLGPSNAISEIELKNRSVGEEIAKWFNYTPITIKEIGENYITISQDNQGPTGYLYSVTTMPETVSKIIISTNETLCKSDNDSFVLGEGSSAIGKRSIAVGYYAQSNGQYSNSFGNFTKSDGNYSHAEGSNTSAFGVCSHTEGIGTTAAGNYSHAGGYYTYAGENATVIGKWNSNTSAAFVVGNGEDINHHSDALVVDWSGNVSAAGTLAISGIADVGTAITSINSVPVSTSADEGKVLTVSSNGSPVWYNAGGSSESFIVRALIYKGANILSDAIIMDKTYSEIDTAYKAGKNVEINFYPVDTTPSSTSDIDTEFETQETTPYIAKLERVSSGRGPDMQLHNSYKFMFKNLDLIYALNYLYSNNVYAYSRNYSSIIIDIKSWSNDVTSIANNMNPQNNIIYIDDTEWTAGQWNSFYDLLIYYLNSHDSLTFRIYTADNQPYRLLRLTRYQPEYTGTTAYFEFIGFNSFSSYDKLTITPVTEDDQTLVHYKFETISAS